MIREERRGRESEGERDRRSRVTKPTVLNLIPFLPRFRNF